MVFSIDYSVENTAVVSRSTKFIGKTIEMNMGMDEKQQVKKTLSSRDRVDARARGETRTLKDILQRLLRPQRLPISPPGHTLFRLYEPGGISTAPVNGVPRARLELARFPATPSKWCVYQFRHLGNFSVQPSYTEVGCKNRVFPDLYQLKA
jgi:hypothetical protein